MRAWICVVGILKLVDVDDRAGQQIGIAGIFDAHLAHHLTDDDLDVLLVDVNALLTVHGENALRQIILHSFDAGDAQHVVRVQRAVGDGFALADALAMLDLQADRIRNLVLLDLAVVGGDGDVAEGGAVRIVDIDHAIDLADLRHLLRLARLEEFLNTGKTLRDIVARDAAGVEGSHGQLRAGLADGLRGNDADSLAEVDQLARRKVHAVAASRTRRNGLCSREPSGHRPLLMPCSDEALGASSSRSMTSFECSSSPVF